MGPTTINGLPAHPLLVHFVVALVPLAALMLLLSVCWPAARARLGVVTPIVALMSLVLVPLTTDAGEWLQHHTDPSPLIRAHAELGVQLIYWSAGVFLVAAAWWGAHDSRFNLWWARRVRRESARTRKLLVGGMAVVAVTLAVGSIVQVYRIGDSGAKAVWQDQVQSASPAAR